MIGKLSCTVPRGLGHSNVTWLPGGVDFEVPQSTLKDGKASEVKIRLHNRTFARVQGKQVALRNNAADSAAMKRYIARAAHWWASIWAVGREGGGSSSRASGVPHFLMQWTTFASRTNGGAMEFGLEWLLDWANAYVERWNFSDVIPRLADLSR